MKFLFGVFFIMIISSDLLSQGEYFAQAKISILEQDIIQNIESEVRLNPYVKVIRIDVLTQQVFVLTKSINSFTEQDLRSWFAENADELTCIHIGVYGIDALKSFPFNDCREGP